jgi:hypothetical protein
MPNKVELLYRHGRQGDVSTAILSEDANWIARATPQRRAFLSSRDGITPTRPPKEPIIAFISLRASSRRSLVFVRCSSASRTSALTLVSRSAANRRAARQVSSSIVKFTVFMNDTVSLFAESIWLVRNPRTSARLWIRSKCGNLTQSCESRLHTSTAVKPAFR